MAVALTKRQLAILLEAAGRADDEWAAELDDAEQWSDDGAARRLRRLRRDLAGARAALVALRPRA